MQNILRTCCVLTASTCLLGAAENVDPHGPVINKYTRLLQEEMGKLNIVGLGVALVGERGVIWAQGFGQANLENSLPVTTNTLFGIGSMTKVFTATAVMQLQGRRALDNDQPMSRAMPEFRIQSRFAGAPPITPRHLLTHHAGVPGDLMGQGDGEDYRSFPRALAGLHATFPPTT